MSDAFRAALQTLLDEWQAFDLEFWKDQHEESCPQRLTWAVCATCGETRARALIRWKQARGAAEKLIDGK